MVKKMGNEINSKERSKESQIIDTKGRVWRTHKDTIEKLADLMNEQSIHPLQTSDELFHIFDAAINPEEIVFMLEMGGGSHTLENLVQNTTFSKENIQKFLDALIYKGQIAIIKDEQGNDVYHIMTIFPGWFELYLMRGVGTEEHKLFAERVEELFVAARKFGNEEVINELMRDVGPHIKVIVASKPKSLTIDLNKEIPINDNQIFATTSITSFFEQLDEDEIITTSCRTFNEARYSKENY